MHRDSIILIISMSYYHDSLFKSLWVPSISMIYLLHCSKCTASISYPHYFVEKCHCHAHIYGLSLCTTHILSSRGFHVFVSWEQLAHNNDQWCAACDIALNTRNQLFPLTAKPFVRYGLYRSIVHLPNGLTAVLLG